MLRPPAKRLSNRVVCAAKDISSYGLAILLPLTPLSGAIFQSQKALSFSTKKIRENTKVNWGINTLTIELEAPAPLPVDTVITLAGLDTPIPSKSRLPLLGPSRDAFYYVGETCPLSSNGAATSCVSTGEWDSGTKKLELTVKRLIAKGEHLELSFDFRNVGCDADFGCAGRTIMISATGPPSENFLIFEPEPMDGQVMGAGVRFISWVRKTVEQTHMVKSAPNKLTFTFRPNTPLYEGTKIILEGIVGSRTTTCKQCRPPNLLNGMGCDADCQECAPEEIVGGGGRTFRPCIPVYSPGFVPLSKHVKFVKNSGWYYDTGRLTLTVAPGEVIPHTEDTQVVIIIQNDIVDPVPDTFRADCVPGARQEDLRSPSACMTITVAAVQLCDPNGVYGSECAKPDGAPVPDPEAVMPSSKAVDAFGKALVDTSPVAVRISDLYELQRTIGNITEMLLDDTKAAVPSLAGVPTLKKGVLAPGNYSIFVNLTNWLNNSARSSFVIFKEHPAPGQGKGVLADENPKPRLMIQGSANRKIFRGDSVSLSAVGRPIDCHEQQSKSLTYAWSMRCEGGGYGYCKNLPPRETILENRFVSDIVLRANSLVPGAKYTFVCEVYQDFLPSKASVNIDVEIRNLIVKIQGVNAGGYVRADEDLVLTAKDSYDPEEFITHQKSQDFLYTWGCKQLRSKCMLPLELCPPNEFIDCPSSWVHHNVHPEGHTITTNSSSFLPDWIYEIRLNVTRGQDKLVDENRDVEDQIFAALPVEEGAEEEEEEEEEEEVAKVWFHEDLVVDPRWLTRTMSVVQFRTLPQTGLPVSVKITLCDPGSLGTDDLCDLPVTRMVDPGSKLVLQASGTSSTQGVITKYAWEIESSQCSSQMLKDEDVLTSKASYLLILKPNVLASGINVKFTVRLEDSQGETGVASIDVLVNRPPGGGGLYVEPSSGTALLTSFGLEARQWTPYVADNLPLRFEFYVLLSNSSSGDNRQTLSLSGGPVMAISTLLPAADPGSNDLLTTGVVVSDSLGTSVESMLNVTVKPAPEHSMEETLGSAMRAIDQLLDEKRLITAIGLVGVVAQTLNQANDVCQGNLEAECLAGVCCERKFKKYQLFLKLKDADSRMLFSASKVSSEIDVLVTLTARPSELGYGIIKEMNGFLKARFTELGEDGIGSALKDSVLLAKTFGAVLENLLTAATQLVPGKVKVPYTMMRSHQENDREFSSAVTSSLAIDSEEVASSRRSSISNEDARSVLHGLISLVSEISRLSVQQAVVGQAPVIIEMATFLVNTSLLNLDAFSADYEAETELGVHASLPTDLFNDDNLKPPKISSRTLEVMHAVFSQEANLLQLANGPILILEPRDRFKGESIGFYDFDTPVKLKMPFTSTLQQCGNGNSTRDCIAPPFEGFTLTPFGKYFDFDRWEWSSSGLKRTKLCKPNDVSTDTTACMETDMYVEMETNHLSVFASSEVWAGCDNVPLSGKYFDDCRVCGGDNSSCSGCDGEPNTGRDKGCSAHGECEYVYDNVMGVQVFRPEKSKCKCVDEYYGDMCSNLCREAVLCSGHGLCESTEGLDCLCFRGWTTSNPEAGVFCDKPSASASLGGAVNDPGEGQLDAATVQMLLVYGIPGFIGMVIVFAVTIYVVSYRRRQRENIRKTVIEFPQPQLEIPAEARPDASVMVPDESGWTNNKLPETTATFSYGPNSGQLASAVAASTRASVGQMSLERIDRRTSAMRKQVKKRSTVNKYKIDGPIHLEGDYEEEDGDDDGDISNGDTGFSGWFLTQTPEWLPQLHTADNSGTDGTPSPEAEAIV